MFKNKQVFISFSKTKMTHINCLYQSIFISYYADFYIMGTSGNNILKLKNAQK